MSPWRARLAVLAVFLAGFLCGAVALHLARFRVQRHVMDNPAGVAGILVHRLDRELHLNADQRKRVEAAATRAREEAGRVMQPLMPQMTTVFDRMRNEIRTALDEEQRRTFDRLVELHRPPFGRMWGAPPPGLGAPPAPVTTPAP
jgi:hypothetical protein